MGRAGLTEFRIHKAADELYAQTGLPPSNKEVHERLKTGSMSTISPAMKVWRERNLPTKDKPAEDPEFLRRALSATWAAMNRHLAEEWEKREDEADQREQTLHKRLDEERTSHEQTKHLLRAERDVANRLQQELDEARSKLESQQEHMQRIKLDREKAETLAAERSDQIREMTAAQSNLNSELTAARQAEIGYTATQAQLEARVQELEQVAAAKETTHRTEIRALSEKLAETQQQLATARNERAEATAELKILRVQNAETAAQSAKLLSDVQRLEEQLRLLNTSLEKAARLEERWEAERAELINDKADLRREIKRLTSEVEKKA